MAQIQDVIIICEDESFECHRSTLASASPYFNAMFNLPFLEKNAKSVFLKEIKAAIFEEVLRFIYTGYATVNSDNFQALIVASDYFILDGLESICMQNLEKDPQHFQRSIVDVLPYAHAIKKVSLLEKLAQHVIKNFKLFSKSKEFLEIPFEFIYRILICLRNPLNMLGMLMSFGANCPFQPLEILEHAINCWIEYSYEERLHHFKQLKSIKLTLNIVDLSLKSLEEIIMHSDCTDYEIFFKHYIPLCTSLRYH